MYFFRVAPGPDVEAHSSIKIVEEGTFHHLQFDLWLDKVALQKFTHNERKRILERAIELAFKAEGTAQLFEQEENESA